MREKEGGEIIMGFGAWPSEGLASGKSPSPLFGVSTTETSMNLSQQAVFISGLATTLGVQDLLRVGF